MKKQSHNYYKTLFVKHVYRFLQGVMQPHELDFSVLVAVSGGRDSMALLWLAHQLHQLKLIGKIRAVFIHHKTRAGQDLEARLVEKYCQRMEIPFQIFVAEGLNVSKGNFEFKARLARKKILETALHKQEWLWQGHHLNDSYEWSFMQRHRSSNPSANLGIPVRNGKIIRPFLCVHRKQITSLCRLESIPFIDDPTNTDSKFERNYLRQTIVPMINKRYPMYLKHYAEAANQQASLLKLNLFRRMNDNQIRIYPNGAIIEGENFSLIQIQNLIKQYSNAQRGEITTEILRMLKAISNGKKGPFQFSGGVEAYHTPHLLMIYQKKFINSDHQLAELLTQTAPNKLLSLPGLTLDELILSWERFKKTSSAMNFMPGMLLILEPKSRAKTLNGSVFDAKYPELSTVTSNKGWQLTSCAKCINTWSKKKEKLPKTLRLVPLWSLAHLFSSH